MMDTKVHLYRGVGDRVPYGGVVEKLIVLTVLGFALSAGGLSADASVSTQIENVSGGEITRFDFDRFMFVSNSTTVDIEVRNTGSSQIESNFTLEVFNDQNTRLYRYFIGPERLDPGEIRTEQLKHTVNRNGTFVLRLAAQLGENRYRVAKTLQAVEVPEGQQQDNITIVRQDIEWIYPPEPEPEERLLRDWNVSYPRTVNMTQGSSRTIPIRITSTAEGPVEDVEFTLETPNGLNVSYEPLFLFEIPSGESRTFLLTISALNDTIDDQSIDFTINSERLSAQGAIDIPINPIRSIRQIREELDTITILASDLEGAVEAANTDIDKEAVRDHIESAYSSINATRNALTSQNIERAETGLETARRNVQEGYDRLYQERQNNISTATQLVSNHVPFIILGVLISGIMLGLYRYYSTEFRKRPALLREEEE